MANSERGSGLGAASELCGGNPPFTPGAATPHHPLFLLSVYGGVPERRDGGKLRNPTRITLPGSQDPNCQRVACNRHYGESDPSGDMRHSDRIFSRIRHPKISIRGAGDPWLWGPKSLIKT